MYGSKETVRLRKGEDVLKERIFATAIQQVNKFLF